MRKRKEQRGSITVEMTMVLPIVLLTIFGMIYLSVVKYQNMVTATAAMQTASKVAANWHSLGGGVPVDVTRDGIAYNAGDVPGAWMLTTDGALVPMPNYTDRNPYMYILDTKKGKREANAEVYMNWLMTGNPEVFGEEKTSPATVETTGGLLQRYISVSVEKTYINPFGNLLESVGIADEMTNVITARAPMNAPTEFIRNVTFVEYVIDLLSDGEDGGESGGEGGEEGGEDGGEDGGEEKPADKDDEKPAEKPTVDIGKKDPLTKEKE